MERPSDSTSAETVVLGSQTPSSCAEEGRFVPGTLLGGRYRIIALLGRGGMGEVYRATDLTLGQSVALKFLPEEAARDQRLLERFHGEVRVARQVSHPNVCRVYDIGEVEGTPFISMEYVDGEDLSSLLTRIGRLPADKALETARRICAGLAAAHDRGIIHRDLKPQNIMMNKRGEVIIMDFGLAALASQLGPTDVRSGTPAYMAPEQLKGAEVTARSDIYSLGLVLYELFTGKRPFDANNLRQLLELQEAAHLTSMTSIAADVDPAVEKAIRRCLDPDPSKRPQSALSVAASLPGGDPLAAALAAGETPSPEIVAAAGETEGLAKRYSIPCLAVVVACFASALILHQTGNAFYRAPLDLPPAALAAKAREIAVALGYPRRPADFEIGLDSRSAMIFYLNHLPEPRKWTDWLASEAPLAAVYRESPLPMVARPRGLVSDSNPAPILQGMASLRLDGYGRLVLFDAVPYELDDTLKEPIPPQTVFHAAGYDFATFQEVAPQEAPRGPADQLHAWKGPHPVLPNTEVTIEIASWRGRITRARVAPAWAPPVGRPRTQASLADRFHDIYEGAINVIGLAAAVLFARRNWKLDRIDRRGAARIAAARFALAMVAWIGGVHAVSNEAMVNIAEDALAQSLLWAGTLWLIYLALEPSVRARWPHALVTWNRLLAGRWRDPLVSSHVLIGAAIGCVIWEVFLLPDLLSGHSNTLSSAGGLYWVLGTRQWIGGHANNLAEAIDTGLDFVCALFFLRLLLKRDWMAAIVAALVGIWLEGGVIGTPDSPVRLVIYFVVYLAVLLVVLRFGLVSAIAAVVFVNSFNPLVLGLDWSTWYAPYGLATMVAMLGIAVGAFWLSLGRKTDLQAYATALSG